MSRSATANCGRGSAGVRPRGRTRCRSEATGSALDLRLLDLLELLFVDRPEVDDLEPARHCGELEDDLVADGLSEQRAPDRGSHAHMPVLEVDRVAEDEIVDLGRAGLLVLDHHARSQADAIVGDLCDVDLRELAESLTELS